MLRSFYPTFYCTISIKNIFLKQSEAELKHLRIEEVAHEHYGISVSILMLTNDPVNQLFDRKFELILRRYWSVDSANQR